MLKYEPHYSEAEIKTLLESVTDLVIVGNKNGIYRCNNLALTFFNVSSAEELNDILPSLGGNYQIRNVSTKKLLKFEDLPLNRALAGEAYKIDISFTTEEHEKALFFHCNGVPISVEDEIVGAVLIFSDYTNENLAKEIIENALNEVEEIKALNKRLEKYSFAIAHDINSPLNKIQGLSHYLLEFNNKPLDPEIRSFIEIIYASSFRLTEYVISLLKLSALDENSLRKKMVLLDPILDDIINTMTTDIPVIKHAITYEKGIEIFADEDLLFGIFQNLLTNAVKFSAVNDAPKIHIGIETNDNKELVVYINDNGLGFDEQDAENIFLPKFRTELSAKFPGKGIGLATVQQIVNSHGGRIWAKGKPGEGATFYIYFPPA